MKIRSKFNNIRVVIDNITFDSRAEARRYEVLAMLQRTGNIESLKIHVTYPITINGQKICSYEADFVYYCKDSGKVIIEDVKGVETPIFKLKKKLMKAVLGFEITIIKPSRVK
jgi:hypothetical protein